jgi:hypothetical protein
MNVYFKSQSQYSKFYEEVRAAEFTSRLEIPDGRNPFQNAWLTITINYSFNFLDRNNLANFAYLKNQKAYAKDSDQTEFPLRDWDFNSIIDFNRRFQKGQEFWNYKFLLLTPADYDGLDFDSIGAGLTCRPNVLCLFRLQTGSPANLTIKVVRPEISGWEAFWGKAFRSNDRLYDQADVGTKTLWHELGHALDQLHIGALRGDKQCLVDINADRCYEGDNIMGRDSTKLDNVNAKAWQEMIVQHTGVPQPKWIVTQAVNTPPRTIPLGVSLVGKPAAF